MQTHGDAANAAAVKDIDRKLNEFAKKMDALSRKRDSGKISDAQFYAEYFPLQAQSVELQARRNSLAGSGYRPR